MYPVGSVSLENLDHAVTQWSFLRQPWSRLLLATMPLMLPTLGVILKSLIWHSHLCTSCPHCRYLGADNFPWQVRVMLSCFNPMAENHHAQVSGPLPDCFLPPQSAITSIVHSIFPMELCLYGQSWTHASKTAGIPAHRQHAPIFLVLFFSLLATTQSNQRKVLPNHFQAFLLGGKWQLWIVLSL